MLDLSNTLSFERFLKDNSISQQKNYLKEHPSKKEYIIQCAKNFLQTTSSQSSQTDLKLKAWLLLPKKIAKDVELDKIRVSSSFEKEIIQNVVDVGKTWRIKHLQKCGINLNTKLENNNTLLHIACFQNDEDKVKELIRLNADPFARNDEGSTPFHIVCQNGNLELLNILLKSVSIIELEQALNADKDNKTPLHYLCENRHEKMATEIFAAICKNRKYSDLKTICIASKKGLSPVAKNLIDNLDDVNKKATKGEGIVKAGDSLVHTLVHTDRPNLEVLQYLINHKKAKLDQKNARGDQPIHVVMKRRMPNQKVLELLINSKVVDINAKNNRGAFPLSMAIFKKPPSEELIRFLIQHKANVDATDSLGRSCRWLINLFKLNIPLVPQTSPRDREFERRQLLANSWSIKGETTLEGQTLTFGQGLGELGQGKVIDLFKSFKEQASDFIDLKEACDLIESAYERSRSSTKQIARDFNEGKPLIFHPGWKGHKISVSIVDQYLLISNRGLKRHQASIKAFKIDRQAVLNEHDILKLLGIIEGKDTETEAFYFYRQLPHLLGNDLHKQDLICEIIEEKCRQSSQKMGNCWWMGPKTGVLGVLLVQNLLKSVSDHPKAEQKKMYEEIIGSYQAIYKYYSEFAKIQTLKEYLEGEYPNPDFKLVEKVVKKLHSKNWKYVFDNQGIIGQTYTFLTKILGKNTEKALPPLYTKAEIDSWVTDFIIKHNLDDHFDRRSVIDPDADLAHLGRTSY